MKGFTCPRASAIWAPCPCTGPWPVGLFLGREFTRDDVSEAFSIEPRRASGILNYICNRHNDDDICFDSRLHPVRGGRAQLVVRIRAVESRPDTIRRQRTDRPGGKVSDRQYDRQMAHWLLSRPAGGDTAKLAARQAACPVREASC